ncbi:MAG TPA: DUF3857 and transglutaminase domain-containing protein [Pyrinomonadaceae bacterium]|nr:DUF3857 and transglutaminase domain-containing protein [Pyrinomonadaceae bacterium]
MSKLLRVLSCACLVLLLLSSSLPAATAATAPAFAFGDDWKPIDPAQLALKAPKVEPDADAEALFWEVRVDDGDEADLIFSHYIRIKIFTERGREAQSKIDIVPFRPNVKIKDVAGRTIKPNGEIVELKKEDVFEKTIAKSGDLKLKAKTFAMPSVEPGAIIEYRWREVYPNRSANRTRLYFQRDIPVQSVTYYIKPASNLVGVEAMRYQPFHMPTPQLVKEKNGFFSATVLNVPAYHEEPRMPPEDEVRKWMLIYYTAEKNIVPQRFWGDVGRGVYSIYKSEMKVNDDVRKKAVEIIGDATSDEQKLERLYEFCRTRIKNLDDDALNLPVELRVKLKDESPANTLKKGEGRSNDIGGLFAALATAAGFEARPALMADRSDIFFNPEFADMYFIENVVIAVKVGESWRFFDPSEMYMPFGMLAWESEMQDALVSDPKSPAFVKTPLSAPDKSLEKRTARLKLDDEGTLEGEVRIEYTGHLGKDKKEYNDDDSPAQREETLRALLKSKMSTAELSNIHIENVTDPVKPFVYAYHVRVPGYAQRTGKRLFLQPAFFQHGANPLFPTSQRHNSVYFHYPWSEQDDVTIDLPAGFALDNADSPAGINGGEVSKYDVKLAVTKDGRTLIYKRNFFFGGGQTGLLFPVTSYATLKALFDEMHKRDNHTITLKQAATTASSSTPSN